MENVEYFHEKLLLPDEEFALLEAAVAAAEREAAARRAARAGSSAEIVVEHPRVDRSAEAGRESAHTRNDACGRGDRIESAGSSAEASSRQLVFSESTHKSLYAWMRPETLFEAPRHPEAPFQAPQMAEPVTRRSLFPDIEDVSSLDALPAEWTRGVAGGAGADGCSREREEGMEAWGMSTEAWVTDSEERGTKEEGREAKEGVLEVRARHVARRPLDCKRNQRLSVTDITDAVLYSYVPVPSRQVLGIHLLSFSNNFFFSTIHPLAHSPTHPFPRSPIRRCSQEWCEQRVLFSLACGKPPPTAAMRAGAERHAALEREVVEAVEVAVAAREDAWALRLLGAAARVLALGEGMREAMGVAMGREDGGVGPFGGDAAGITREPSPHVLQPPSPLLLSHPLSPRCRLQLMCYSALLSSMIRHGVPQEPFFSSFRLRPRTTLSPQVLQHAAEVFPRRMV
ncbi:unnamed protein product [Closterium sp. Naga37s-1]|nr:unnamed protein product [Closterium sp. Naga37s-1]